MAQCAGRLANDLPDSDVTKTVFVTGAMGHYGKETIMRLMKEQSDFTIIASDFKADAPTCDQMKVDLWGPDGTKVYYVSMDLSKPESRPLMDDICKRCHYVIALGAFPGPLMNKKDQPPGLLMRGEDPEEQWNSVFADCGKHYDYMGQFSSHDLLAMNCAGSQALFEAAIKARVRRVVFTSTCFAYGWCHHAGDFVADYLPIDEESSLYPLEHYGLSKQVAENQIAMLTRAGGISRNMSKPWTDGGGPSFVVLRFPNSLWKPQWNSDTLPFKKTEKPEFGGPVMWCYVHEDDVLDGILSGMFISEEKLGCKNQSFNLSAPDTRMDVPTMKLIQEHWKGRDTPMLKRPLDGHASLFSNAKAARVLGINFKSFRIGDSRI